MKNVLIIIAVTPLPLSPLPCRRAAASGRASAPACRRATSSGRAPAHRRRAVTADRAPPAGRRSAGSGRASAHRRHAVIPDRGPPARRCAAASGRTSVPPRRAVTPSRVGPSCRHDRRPRDVRPEFFNVSSSDLFFNSASTPTRAEVFTNKFLPILYPSTSSVSSAELSRGFPPPVLVLMSTNNLLFVDITNVVERGLALPVGPFSAVERRGFVDPDFSELRRD